MESCELRLALDELCTDVGDCPAGARPCWRRTSPRSRHRRGSAMAALLKAPAFRQYSGGEMADLKSMSRQNLVDILRARLVDAAKHDFSPYIDSRRQLGLSTRRYFSNDRGDVTLTSSGEDSPDDDVIKHLLRRGRNVGYWAFRMPTFAEFLAERRRNRTTLRKDDRRSNLKVSQGQGVHHAVASGRFVSSDVGNDSGSNSSNHPSTIYVDNTVSEAPFVAFLRQIKQK